MKKEMKNLKLDSIHMHPYLSRVLQYCTQPDFIDKAMLEYGVFDNACVFYEDRICYELNHRHVFNLARQQGIEKITVTVVDINKEDLIKALIVFNFHTNKQPRAMAELVKIVVEYRDSPKGAEWIKESTKSDNKETQIAILLGITKHMAKCYLKIIKDEYADILEMLGVEFGPTQAYEEACTRDNKRRASEKPEAPATTLLLETTTATDVSGESTEDNGDEDILDVPTPIIEEPISRTPPAKAKPRTSIYLGESIKVDTDPNVFSEHLEDYKSSGGSPKHRPLFPGGVEIRVFDGAKLAFDGKVELSIDKQPVISESQLQKIGSNRYVLPKVFDEVTLIVRYKREDLDLDEDSTEEDFFYDL